LPPRASTERADRFRDYTESRIEDAQRAHGAVHRIADNIPFGPDVQTACYWDNVPRFLKQKTESTMITKRR
jgi:hypothetical protein